MTACPTSDQLQHLLEDALPAGLQHAVQAHLEHCPDCQQALEHMAAAGPSWDRAARHLACAGAPAGPALAQVVAQLEACPANPSAPDNETQPHTAPAYLSAFACLDASAPLGRLGHYQLLAVIGRGGMGVVFRALDERLQREVAVKALGPQYAANGQARIRFQREAEAAAAISHDHVVPIYHVDEAHGIPYLVMPLIDGESLQERIDDTGALTLRNVLRIGAQTASGLAAAHARGLVHRDIKPANILLESDDRVRITDFGLARAVDDASITQSGVITGTPMFMAPEQARGEVLDQRADLFSLGSVLYMMATGRSPFYASGPHAVIHRIINDVPRPMRELNADVPDWLDAIVARLHAKHPADRFQSAQEVADLLGQHLAHLEEPSRVPQPSQVARPAQAACRTPSLRSAGGTPAAASRWTAAAVALVGFFLLSTCSLVSMLFGGAITAGVAIFLMALRSHPEAPRSGPPPTIMGVPVQKGIPVPTARDVVLEDIRLPALDRVPVR